MLAYLYVLYTGFEVRTCDLQGLEQFATSYLEYGEREESGSWCHVARDVQAVPVGCRHQLDRLDRVPEVVDPVEASGGVVDRQTERLVEVLADEDLTTGAVQARSLDLRHRSEVRPVQRTGTHATSTRLTMRCIAVHCGVLRCRMAPHGTAMHRIRCERTLVYVRPVSTANCQLTLHRARLVVGWVTVISGRATSVYGIRLNPD